MQAPLKTRVQARGAEADDSGECIIQEPALTDKAEHCKFMPLQLQGNILIIDAKREFEWH